MRLLARMGRNEGGGGGCWLARLAGCWGSCLLLLLCSTSDAALLLYSLPLLHPGRLQKREKQKRARQKTLPRSARLGLVAGPTTPQCNHANLYHPLLLRRSCFCVISLLVSPPLGLSPHPSAFGQPCPPGNAMIVLARDLAALQILSTHQIINRPI